MKQFPFPIESTVEFDHFKKLLVEAGLSPDKITEDEKNYYLDFTDTNLDLTLTEEEDGQIMYELDQNQEPLITCKSTQDKTIIIKNWIKKTHYLTPVTQIETARRAAINAIDTAVRGIISQMKEGFFGADAKSKLLNKALGSADRFETEQRTKGIYIEPQEFLDYKIESSGSADKVYSLAEALQYQKILGSLSINTASYQKVSQLPELGAYNYTKFQKRPK